MPIKLNGSTSGSVELNVPAAVGSDLQVTIPATAGEVIVKAADGSVDLGAVDISSSGQLGIGTTSPATGLHLEGVTDASSSALRITATGACSAGISCNSTGTVIGTDTGGILFKTGISANTPNTTGTERLRIDSSGNLGLGTASPNSFTNYKVLTIQGTTASGIDLEKADGTIQARFFGDATGVQIGAPAGSVRFETANTERMRIDSSGKLMVGTTDTTVFSNTSGAGVVLDPVGAIQAARSAEAGLFVNRMTNDGVLVAFYQAGNFEGSISVSGTTVSYNGAHLSRWSQLPGGVERTQILRGSVLSNLDEMCEWGEEDNEQLNRMKVSDTEGDKNVSGVFQDWDDDDDTYVNDFYCAMTGDFVIRIAQGTTVARGDLLMSAGDGTAKPQDDDIVRSKTIAKVTSTTVSETYADNSYCVPCVLMAC